MFFHCSNSEQHREGNREQPADDHRAVARVRALRVVPNGVPKGAARDAQAQTQDHPHRLGEHRARGKRR